jgi:hypothetical protein
MCWPTGRSYIRPQQRRSKQKTERVLARVGRRRPSFRRPDMRTRERPISAASRLSPGTISTPATARSVMSRIFSWTMLAGTSVTSKSLPVLVARRAGDNLAALGARDRLGRQIGAHKCQPPADQRRSALRPVHHCRWSIRRKVPDALRH